MTKKKKNKKSGRYLIPVPIYNFYIDIAIHQCHKKLDKQNRKFMKITNGPDEKIFTSAARVYPSYVDDKGYRIQPVLFAQKFLDPGCLSHEVFHIVYAAMERAGINITRDSEEAFAYLQGWIHHEIDERIKHLYK